MLTPTSWVTTAFREFAARVRDLSWGEGNSTGEHRIHLTFDDGPHPNNTPRLLDELNHAGILATFFVVGKQLETPQAQRLLERIASEGHQVGNHTYSHPYLTRLEEKQIREEILKTERLIGGADRGIKVFRPPFGDRNLLVDQIVSELGYRLVLWNVDALDWHPDYEHRWVQHAMRQIVTREDSLVLTHDRLTSTVDQVGSFIRDIRELSDSKFIGYSEAFPEKLIPNHARLRPWIISRHRERTKIGSAAVPSNAMGLVRGVSGTTEPFLSTLESRDSRFRRRCPTGPSRI